MGREWLAYRAAPAPTTELSFVQGQTKLSQQVVRTYSRFLARGSPTLVNLCSDVQHVLHVLQRGSLREIVDEPVEFFLGDVLCHVPSIAREPGTPGSLGDSNRPTSAALVVEAVVADEAAFGVVEDRAAFRAADTAGDGVGVLAGVHAGVGAVHHLVDGDEGGLDGGVGAIELEP